MSHISSRLYLYPIEIRVQLTGDQKGFFIILTLPGNKKKNFPLMSPKKNFAATNFLSIISNAQILKPFISH